MKDTKTSRTTDNGAIISLVSGTYDNKTSYVVLFERTDHYDVTRRFVLDDTDRGIQPVPIESLGKREFLAYGKTKYNEAAKMYSIFDPHGNKGNAQTRVGKGALKNLSVRIDLKRKQHYQKTAKKKGMDLSEMVRVVMDDYTDYQGE